MAGQRSACLKAPTRSMERVKATGSRDRGKPNDSITGRTVLGRERKGEISTSGLDNQNHSSDSLRYAG